MYDKLWKTEEKDKKIWEILDIERNCSSSLLKKGSFINTLRKEDVDTFDEPFQNYANFREIYKWVEIVWDYLEKNPGKDVFWKRRKKHTEGCDLWTWKLVETYKSDINKIKQEKKDKEIKKLEEKISTFFWQNLSDFLDWMEKSKVDIASWIWDKIKDEKTNTLKIKKYQDFIIYCYLRETITIEEVVIISLYTAMIIENTELLSKKQEISEAVIGLGSDITSNMISIFFTLLSIGYYIPITISSFVWVFQDLRKLSQEKKEKLLDTSYKDFKENVYLYISKTKFNQI